MFLTGLTTEALSSCLTWHLASRSLKLVVLAILAWSLQEQPVDQIPLSVVFWTILSSHNMTLVGMLRDALHLSGEQKLWPAVRVSSRGPLMTSSHGSATME